LPEGAIFDTVEEEKSVQGARIVEAWHSRILKEGKTGRNHELGCSEKVHNKRALLLLFHFKDSTG